MARNELVPQDYCNMVVDYIASFKGLLPFTVKAITKYCIKKTQVLDEGDEEQIEHIVRETLETLRDTGYLTKSAGLYVAVKDVLKADIYVMEEPKPMKQLSKEMIDRLNEIDRNTQYLGDNL